MIDDSVIPESMPKADEYNKASEVAVIEALKSGNSELLSALHIMMDFTGGLAYIVGKAVEERDE